MTICIKCKNEMEIYESGKRCKKCILQYKRDWKRKKHNRKCEYCGVAFIPNGARKECSIKCKLLNTVKINNGCWEWQGKIGISGYGQLRQIKDILAHRVSYEIFKGEIPKGRNVCHKCDNKKCINPDHLWIGTQKDNILDAKIKGRLADQRGRKHSEKAKILMRKRKLDKPTKYWLGKQRSKETIDKIKQTKMRNGVSH